jgi:hypothetical protein
LSIIVVAACSTAAPKPVPAPAPASAAPIPAAPTPVDRACADIVAGAPDAATLDVRCHEAAKQFKTQDAFVNCTEYLAKSRPIIHEIQQRAGIASQSIADEIAHVAGCEENANDPQITCVAGAGSEDEVRRCFGRMYAMLLHVFTASSDRPEAVRELEHIGELAKAYAKRTGSFPRGNAPAPTTSCCGTPDMLCALEGWDAAPWKELGYQPAGPTLFQYGYESDGKTFTAVAIGDMDCDKIEVRYTLTGRIERGEPAVTLRKPPPGTD